MNLHLTFLISVSFVAANGQILLMKGAQHQIRVQRAINATQFLVCSKSGQGLFISLGRENYERLHLTCLENEDNSDIWEQMILDEHKQLDARKIVGIIGDNLQLVSAECSQDIHLIKSLLELELGADRGNLSMTDFDRQVILPMLDSSGRIGPAILRGRIRFDGHFSECKAIDFPVENRARHLRGEYFRIAVDVAFKANNDNGSCADGALEFKFGVCLPKGCTSADLMTLFRPDTGTPAIPNAVCAVQRTNDDLPPFDAGFYIVASIMGIIAFISILAGAVDYGFSDLANKTGISKALPWRIFMCFSLYSNIASILDVSEAAKGGQIGPIHCIRFFSMSWVVLGHVSSAYIQIAANPFDMLRMGQDFFSEFLMNSYFAVDSFYFMSGLLLTFTWFKNYQKNPQATNSPLSWVLFYVHRLIRLSPPFYMAIAFYTFVYKQMFADLPINMIPLYQDYCRETWYIEFLYAHNWWKEDKQCMSVTWYLASEMQIFLFTPLFILPLAIKPAIGFIVAAAALIISTGTNIFLVYHYHWPTNLAYLFKPDPEITHFLDDYNMLMYDSPLIRCQACLPNIYIMGMLVGWFLQKKKQLTINPLINIACWILGISLMLCVVLGLHDQSNGFYISIFWRAMYSSLSRIAWGLGLTWIIVSCWYGYGGPINKFMSWHIWIPFGRLTYCGYLLHIPVIFYIFGQSTDTVFFSTFLEVFITRVVSTIAVTFLISTFWSALFEISFGKIQIILLGGLRANKKERIGEGN